MPTSFEKPTHLIFLDIDGVLRPARAYDDKLQKKPIEHVKKIAGVLDSRIVITSTWRDIHSWEMFNRPDIFDGLVIGETPNIDEMHGQNGRYGEVLAWLKTTGNQDIPWIALDDKRVHYPALPNVYWTNPDIGVDQALVENILHGKKQVDGGAGLEDAGLRQLLGTDLYEKISDYATARKLTFEVALRQVARAGLFLITEG